MYMIAFGSLACTLLARTRCSALIALRAAATFIFFPSFSRAKDLRRIPRRRLRCWQPTRRCLPGAACRRLSPPSGRLLPPSLERNSPRYDYHVGTCFVVSAKSCGQILTDFFFPRPFPSGFVGGRCAGCFSARRRGTTRRWSGTRPPTPGGSPGCGRCCGGWRSR